MAYIFGLKHDIGQLAKCIANYKESPITSQNSVDFGLQTASNLTAIFTHPT